MRRGEFITVDDSDGCQHRIRIQSIQWLSDTDQCHGQMLIIAGRTVHIPGPMDEVTLLIEASTTGSAVQRAIMGSGKANQHTKATPDVAESTPNAGVTESRNRQAERTDNLS